jgi:hypothetical protein
VNNWPALRVYILCQYEHHLAEYGYFIGLDIMCFLVKMRAKPVLGVVFVACICLGFVTLFIAQKGAVIAQWGNSANTLDLRDIPQAISKEDHKFLDDLFQEQNLENQRATAQSDSKPVPRAELIVNTSEVKRAQLVVNNRAVERAELVRRRN